MMADLKSCFAASDAVGLPAVADVEALVRMYPWFLPGRLLLARLSGVPDPRVAMMAPWRAESSLCRQRVDVAALEQLSSGEIIDRFLGEENLRIVAQEGEPEVEVRVAPELEDEDELVSEELAEIYLAQGLRDRAAAIYRKLSLLNPEKSVYFAELIAKMENNN